MLFIIYLESIGAIFTLSQLCLFKLLKSAFQRMTLEFSFSQSPLVEDMYLCVEKSEASSWHQAHVNLAVWPFFHGAVFL